MVIVFVPLGEPPNTSTLYMPSVNVPSVVVKVWDVPDRAKAKTPLIDRSIISMLRLIVVPHSPV